MTQLAIEPSMSRKLSQITEPVQLVDGEGNVLGVFRPPIAESVYSEIQPPLSLEELRRRAASPKAFTTQEVLKRLESL